MRASCTTLLFFCIIISFLSLDSCSSSLVATTDPDTAALVAAAAANNAEEPEDIRHPPHSPSRGKEGDSSIGDDIPMTDNFWTSFFTAFVMILVSECGDKTFLIAAIMAMRHSRMMTFTAALGALALMTIISAAFGLVLPNLIPRKYTLWGASFLFAVFGMKMLLEGWKMSPQHMQDEYDEVNHEIEGSEEVTRRRDSSSVPRSPTRLEAGPREASGGADALHLRRLVNLLYSIRVGRLVNPVALQTFSLTFLAEWGDRSQITTIALAAAQNVYGVALGAIAGHALCTALAVVSGRLLSNVMNIRTVTMIGGVSFLAFAVFAVL